MFDLDPLTQIILIGWIVILGVLSVGTLGWAITDVIAKRRHGKHSPQRIARDAAKYLHEQARASTKEIHS